MTHKELFENWDRGFGDMARTENLELVRQYLEDNSISAVGPSSDRPTEPTVGQKYFDTDLGKPIYWNGTEWVDALGNSADTTYVTDDSE